MENTIAAFTIFTLMLFTVSTASIALDQIALPVSDVEYKFPTKSVTVADSNVVIPAEMPESELEKTSANDRFPDPAKIQTFEVNTIESTPRLIFSRSYPIQRHFDRTSRIPLRFVKRHPCRKFEKSFIIPTKRSYGNDMILSDKTTSVDLETLGDEIPTNWLEFKHKYGHRHHHYHHDNDEKFELKKREHKSGFMRSIRKFLKHTFD